MPVVVENAAQHRFELPIEHDAVAAAYYRVDGNRVVLTHTEVPSAFSGRGIATQLADATFALVRQSGRKAVLQCAFMNDFFHKHPEYADIVDG